MRELLLLHAARTVGQRTGRGGLTPLRALGAVLTALSGPPSAVRLRLDDIELEEGTTERSTDVARLLERPTPYDEERALAAELLRRGGAGAAVAREGSATGPRRSPWRRRVRPRCRWSSPGPFVDTHRAVLATLPAFQRASFPEVEPLRWRVAAPGATEPEPGLLWIPEGAPLRREEGPWAGSVPLRRLLEPETLVAGGLHTAVVGLCALDERSAVGSDGSRVETEALAAALRRLRSAGVRVVAEWWVGAPGVDEAAHERTFASLGERPLFDWVSGVRTFHWTRGRPEADFAGVPVRLLAPPGDRDLARTVPFEAPETLPRERVAELLGTLAGAWCSARP